MNRPEVPHRLKDYRYAPLRVVPFEDKQSKGIFEYDKAVVILWPVRR